MVSPTKRTWVSPTNSTWVSPTNSTWVSWTNSTWISPTKHYRTPYFYLYSLLLSTEPNITGPHISTCTVSSYLRNLTLQDHHARPHILLPVQSLCTDKTYKTFHNSTQNTVSLTRVTPGSIWRSPFKWKYMIVEMSAICEQICVIWLVEEAIHKGG